MKNQITDKQQLNGTLRDLSRLVRIFGDIKAIDLIKLLNERK